MAIRQADDAQVRSRCSSCRRILSFDEWSSGYELCSGCARSRNAPGPAATFVHGPAPARARSAPPDLPEEIFAELLAALEAEARSPSTPPQGALREVLAEIGIERSARQVQWTAWGFAAGFAGNVAVAKYAQMATGAPMGQFVGPFIIGGLVAGAACALIGWGFARLREV
ncbi:MAG: hypothetical protein HY875_07480 [Chloroflexi bacterium]|nr:hypothetical protein [Chloroflexota bacterium]